MWRASIVLLMILSLVSCWQPSKVLRASTFVEQQTFLNIETTTGSFLLLLDTGCAQSWLSQELIKTLGIKTIPVPKTQIYYPFSGLSIATSAQTVNARAIENLTVNIEAVSVVDTASAVTYSKQIQFPLGTERSSFGGVLGFDILRNYILTFDSHSFSFSAPGMELPQRPVIVAKLPIHIRDGFAWIEESGKKQTNLPVLIDTGALTDMVIAYPKSQETQFVTIKSSYTTWIGGRKMRRVQTPYIGGFSRYLPKASFGTELDTPATAILGTPFFREYAATIHFPANELWLSTSQTDYAPSAIANAYF